MQNPLKDIIMFVYMPCLLFQVGVHSAKFDNEKDPENIEAALRRYEVTHPVVNDPEGVMWNKLGISCWPTLLILSESKTIFLCLGSIKLFVKVLNSSINSSCDKVS